jgi:hypothetical protein
MAADDPFNPYDEEREPSKGEKQVEWADQAHTLVRLAGWQFTPTEVEALAKVIGAIIREWKR